MSPGVQRRERGEQAKSEAKLRKIRLERLREVHKKGRQQYKSKGTKDLTGTLPPEGEVQGQVCYRLGQEICCARFEKTR